MIIEAVLVPLLQALITGLFSCAIVWAMFVLCDFPNARTWGELIGAFIALFSWLSYIDRFYAGLKAQLPENDKKETSIRILAIQDDGQAGSDLDLPFDKDRFILVCQAVHQGWDFSLSSLGGHGKLLTRSEFEAMRNMFIIRGLAEWINPHGHNQGVKLTPAGRGIIRRYADPEKHAYTRMRTQEGCQ